MATKIVEFLRDEAYPFHVENEIDGWAGAGFDRKFTEVKARKVNNGEVQVEISITELKGERSFRRYGSLVLSPELQAVLMEVLR